MHRHMWSVGDQCAIGIKDGAGEVKPLLDVDRIGRVLQRHAHLFGDRHEQVVEHFQHDRICMGANGVSPLQFDDALQDDMVLGIDLGLPAVFNSDGGMWLDDHGDP